MFIIILQPLFLKYSFNYNLFFIHIQGDENKPKSWSKYAPDSTAYKKEHGTLKSEEVLTKNDEPKTKKKSKLKPEIKEKLKQVIL